MSKYSSIKSIPEGFEEFTERTHYDGRRITLRRCLTHKRHTNKTVQCNSICVNGYNVCYHHGGAKGSGKKTAQGIKNQIAAVTTHGKRTAEHKAKVNKRTKQHRTLTKLAYALGEQTYTARGQQLEIYPKPTLADVPDLINTLLTLENTTAE
jgi:hypothetical protein